jgi:hypothetical protein
MSTPSNAGKICVSCGEDVAAKPRTKDAKGRYYCQPCYQKAIASKHAKRESAPMPKVGPPLQRQARDEFGLLIDDGESAVTPPPIIRNGGTGYSGSDPNVLESLLDIEPAHEAPSMICPSCRSKIAAGGFLCTVCGYNMQTQEQVGAIKVKAQRVAGGTVWPIIVGIISIVFGAGGVIVYGLYLLLAVWAGLQSGALASALTSIIPAGTLLTGLALWLLRDGIRIVRRDAHGVKWIRFWALTKLIIYGSCFGLLMSIPPGPLEEGLRAAPGGSDLSVSDVKSSILIAAIFCLFWPAFVLVFFFIPRIQDDVEAWG